MPFIHSGSKAALAKNIREALKSYVRKGTFGSSRPMTTAAAKKQVLAAAYANQKRYTRASSAGH